MTPPEEEACRQALIWRERYERLRDALHDLLAEELPLSDGEPT